MKLRLIKNKLFIRYLLGFILVFIFPVSILASSYRFYFLPSYTEKILNLYEEQAYRSGTFIETILKNVDTISQQMILSKSDALGKVTDIVLTQRHASEQLKSISLTNDNFSFINIYNSSADTIYSENGSYSPEYYYHFRVNDRVVDLSEIVESIESSTIWLSGEEICNTHGLQTSKWMMMGLHPLTETSCLIVSVNVPYVQMMVENEVVPIVLLDNHQVLPFSSVSAEEIEDVYKQNKNGTQWTDGDYWVFYRSGLYDLLCAYRIPAEAIAESVHPIGRISVFVFSLISVLGGALIIYMSFMSYRPIHRVKEIIVGDHNGSMDNPDDLDAIHQSFEQLRNRIIDSDRQAEESRVLMKLFYARNHLSRSLKEECANVGIKLDVQRFYILYAIRLTDNLDDILEESAVFVKTMEYTAGSSQLALIGVQNTTYDDIPFELRSYTEQTQGCNFILSYPCDSAEDIADCYAEVIQTAAMVNEDSDRFILCVKPVSHGKEFVFPRSEIKALFHALSTSNVDNALLLLDNLSTVLADDTVDEFYRFSVYADAINTCIEALDSIGHESIADEMRSYAIAYANKILDHRGMQLDFNGLKEIFEEHSSSFVGSNEKMMNVLEFIRNNYSNPDLNVSMVADHFGLSQSNLSHQFKTRFDLRISDYIRQVQISYACELLENTEMSIADISKSLGYTQISSFIRKFKQETGKTPNQYRQKNHAQ